MDSRMRCSICRKTFTQKSSLVRHSKRCAPGPAPSLRQKSCRACTSSKTKCDLQRPKCTRCESRDTVCEYIIPMTRGTRTSTSSPDATDHDAGSANDHSDENEVNFSVAEAAPINFSEAPSSLLGADLNLNLDPPLAAFGYGGAPPIDEFHELPERDSLIPFPWSVAGTPDNQIEACLTAPTPFLLEPGAICSETSTESGDFGPNDWMLWNHGPPRSTPPLVKHSMETLLRVMKTWPKALGKGFQIPPMVHHSNVRLPTMFPPVANCITMAKIWAGQGEGSADVVRQAIIQEMRVLFQQYRSMDERHLLSALQALTMYTIMLMYPGCSQIAVSLVDPAIFLCLQKMVSYVAKTGLMLTEERDHERPSWESWLHVTAKRRAIFSLYLLHWAYSVHHGLPSFECSQLGFMPAPAPKFLWQAETREKWEELYNCYLEQWGEYPYMMREFAAIQSGTNLENRTELWLEDADELGVLFFTIVNATEREPIFAMGNGIPVLSV
ncbi:hypothetical protein EJ04DRAFT_552504 [Polyplosphaeria fusca]|uniref:Zn(2)-C6 fungal-type domain-containing protein n=1 Tax=Polyplosphaeria fusca TaxID=682080 RepID=A0A9P4R0V1_9PLEO|nr:hypothetical protein EJ04DRAFT_552504 [Polyplosphaeria fusca]